MEIRNYLMPWSKRDITCNIIWMIHNNNFYDKIDLNLTLSLHKTYTFINLVDSVHVIKNGRVLARLTWSSNRQSSIPTDRIHTMKSWCHSNTRKSDSYGYGCFKVKNETLCWLTKDKRDIILPLSDKTSNNKLLEQTTSENLCWNCKKIQTQQPQD